MKWDKDVAQRAARHGLRAHSLYRLAYDLRLAALDAALLDEQELSQLLIRHAKRLDGARRRQMRRAPD